jgi:P pilus assembly chaperone PapD
MQPFVFLWRCCCGLIALLLLVMLLWEVPTAHATIVLDPIITFEGRSRQATVRVVNDGAQVMTYRISVVNLRRQPDGSFVEAETTGPDDRFARDFVDFSPRQVTIAPNQTQVIRLLLRKPAQLAPGEYRSYLRIAELPQAETPAAGMQVNMTINHQFPIIVRQ